MGQPWSQYCHCNHFILPPYTPLIPVSISQALAEQWPSKVWRASIEQLLSSHRATVEQLSSNCQANIEQLLDGCSTVAWRLLGRICSAIARQMLVGINGVDFQNTISLCGFTELSAHQGGVLSLYELHCGCAILRICFITKKKCNRNGLEATLAHLYKKNNEVRTPLPKSVQHF